MLPQVEDNVWDFYLSMKNIAHTRSTLVGILYFYFSRVPSVSYERHFIVLGIPGRASKFFMIGFYLLPATNLWAFSPFFPRNEVHSLLGSVHPKIPKDKETNKG
jgi:hypothetical protein